MAVRNMRYIIFYLVLFYEYFGEQFQNFVLAAEVEATFANFVHKFGVQHILDIGTSQNVHFLQLDLFIGDHAHRLRDVFLQQVFELKQLLMLRVLVD